MRFFLIFFCLLFFTFGEDGIIVEEGETVTATEDDISLAILEILTDISETDQPTRIRNSNAEKIYYILESENIEYFVTIDSEIVDETVFSESFLQLNKAN